MDAAEAERRASVVTRRVIDRLGELERKHSKLKS